MLLHLVPAQDGSGAERDLVHSPKRAPLAAGGLYQLVQVLLRSLQEFLAAARRPLGPDRIAAYHQALARIVVTGDLGHVLLVEERQLEAVLLRQLADGRLAQGRDPVIARRPYLLFEAGVRQQPPVCHDGHLAETEAMLQLAQLPRQRTGIGHRAREDLHTHGPALFVTQKAKVDLFLALLAVTVVAELGQVGAVALHVGARHVTEHDGAFRKVAPCQLLFYGLLAGKEPVHGLVDLVLVDMAKPQLVSQAAGLAFLLERLGGGELAAGTENARGDKGKYDVALP